MGLGFKEILIIGVIIILLFGAKKIPELMRGIGKGIREFDDAKNTDGKTTTTTTTKETERT